MAKAKQAATRQAKSVRGAQPKAVVKAGKAVKVKAAPAATRGRAKPKPKAPAKAFAAKVKRAVSAPVAKTVTKRSKTTRAKRPARKVKVAPPVVRVVKVRELDPIAKCGPSTSVEQLFRVDESAGGHATVHLVFFDRHGWYCVHGPRCAAVSDVHSHTRQRTRTDRR